MTETWERLWVHDIPEEEFDRTVNTDWLRRVKAEGDKLKYHADWVRRLENFKDINFHQRNIIAIPKSHYDGLNKKAEKWEKAYSRVYDDELPFTPERISLIMNFVNEHFPDFDTPKEFEDMITEYTDWETELTEAEDKLEAIKKHLKTNPYSANRRGTVTRDAFTDWRLTGLQILEDQTSTDTATEEI